MNWTPERLLIVGLLVLLIIAILIILKKSSRKNKYNVEDNGSRGSVPRIKFEEEFRRREMAEEQLGDYKGKYEFILSKNRELERDIQKLQLTINELSRLYDNNTERANLEQCEDSVPVNVQNTEGETSSNNEEPRNIMYASFPRSAGSTIYFSDLTDKLVDDSYFELRITSDTEKASFRPLDFMKIRNYDPAMAAILTDGVKPNVASTVVGVEPGDAYLEGNDWIIKKLAKIKLA